MYDVITIGSNTTDVFVYTDKTKTICMKALNDEACYISYPIGSKLIIDELDFHIGGGGTNTAVCLSRLGLKTGYLGKLGKDSRAGSVMELMERENIDFLGTTDKKDNKSGYSVILDSLEKQRTVLTYKGVNDFLFYDEIDLEKLKAGWFCMTSMMEESFRTLEKLSEYAEKKDIRIMFNPSNYLCEKGTDYLGKLLKNVHILVLNDEEAGLLVGHADKATKLETLKELGPEIVLITEGGKAVHCMDAKGVRYMLHPPRVKVVETTGAGDAFAATFLAGFIKEKDIEYALRLAAANSSSVLKYRGAKRKLLSLEDAEEVVKKKKIIVEKNR
jgi:ribokinase